MTYEYIRPYKEDKPKRCPRCGCEINPFGIILEENCGFLGLGIKRTSIKSCMKCDYKIKKRI